MKFSRLKSTGGTDNFRWTVIGMIEHPDENIFVRTNRDIPIYAKKPIRYINMTEISSIFGNYNLNIELYHQKNSIFTVPLTVLKPDKVKYRFYPLKLKDVDVSSN